MTPIFHTALWHAMENRESFHVHMYLSHFQASLAAGQAGFAVFRFVGGTGRIREKQRGRESLQ